MAKLGIGMAALLLGTSVYAHAHSAGTGQAITPNGGGVKVTAPWQMAEQQKQAPQTTQPSKQKAPQQRSGGSRGSKQEAEVD